MFDKFRLTPAKYQRITYLSVLLLSLIIVTGAAVRLTGSGLGCSDWPTCEDDQLVAEIDDVHAMVEFVNRVITGVVSLAVIFAVLGSLFREPRRKDLTWWSLGLVVGVIVQILVGALVVREHLPPSLVIAHFLISMVLVWNAVELHHRAKFSVGLPPQPTWTPLRSLSSLLVLLASGVLVTGTLVTGSGPHSGAETTQTKEALENFQEGALHLNSESFEVKRLPFDVPDVARIHAITMIVFLIVMTYTVFRISRIAKTKYVFSQAQNLLTVAVLQGAIGYTQYFTDVPALLVGFHIAGAVAVWIMTLRLYLAFRLPIEPNTKQVTP
ncbi:MAG: cytochrome oxidase assembly protein [Acidimicrobiaceae bacterium]|nr:cytochrome oxidase assembly protein [Acidimicrobiaceae bacterium]